MTNNKQQTTNNKQQTTNNKQQTTNNKQQTTKNKQSRINNQQTLADLRAAHQGKVSEKWQLYLDVYERTVQTYRDKKVNLLEIGVQNGGSLELWAKYFPFAQNIIGCDINPACGQLSYDDKRVHVCVGDANQADTHAQILAISPSFDIIIDDGSHYSTDIIRTFALYFDHLNDGGIMIIEDLCCSYWENYLGGLKQPFSSMNFLKQLADIVNFEHWRTHIERATLLQHYWQALQCPAPTHLAHIHSIEFVNSLCIIRKRAPQENEMGLLHWVGKEATVSVHPWHQQEMKVYIDHIAPPKDASTPFVSDFVEMQLLRQRVQELEQENQQYRSIFQQIQTLTQKT